MPRVQQSVVYSIKERISLGFQKVLVYQLQDSLNVLSRQRYMPLYLFELQDEQGRILQRYVGAYVEFVSRVAGTMTQEQKSQVQPSMLRSLQTDSASLLTVWAFPRNESDFHDVDRGSTFIKSSYWSVDSLSSERSIEVFTTRSLSVPLTGNQVRFQRQSDDVRIIQREAESQVYYEFKKFVLTRLHDR